MIHKVSAKLHNIKLVELFTRSKTKLIWYFFDFSTISYDFSNYTEKEIKRKETFATRTLERLQFLAIGSLVGV